MESTGLTCYSTPLTEHCSGPLSSQLSTRLLFAPNTDRKIITGVTETNLLSQLAMPEMPASAACTTTVCLFSNTMVFPRPVQLQQQERREHSKWLQLQKTVHFHTSSTSAACTDCPGNGLRYAKWIFFFFSILVSLCKDVSVWQFQIQYLRFRVGKIQNVAWMVFCFFVFVLFSSCWLFRDLRLLGKFGSGMKKGTS